MVDTSACSATSLVAVRAQDRVRVVKMDAEAKQ